MPLPSCPPASAHTGRPPWNALAPLPTRPGPALLSGVLGACGRPAHLLQGPTPHGVSQEHEFPERRLYAQPRSAENPKLPQGKLLGNTGRGCHLRRPPAGLGHGFPATGRLHGKAVQRWNASPGHHACEQKPGAFTVHEHLLQTHGSHVLAHTRAHTHTLTLLTGIPQVGSGWTWC